MALLVGKWLKFLASKKKQAVSEISFFSHPPSHVPHSSHWQDPEEGGEEVREGAWAPLTFTACASRGGSALRVSTNASPTLQSPALSRLAPSSFSFISFTLLVTIQPLKRRARVIFCPLFQSLGWSGGCGDSLYICCLHKEASLK